MDGTSVIVVDTTVVIDLLRGDPRAAAWLGGQSEVIAASEVTRAEVLQGMRSSERRTTPQALRGYRWLPVDEAVSTRAGELGRQYRASHDLDLADLLIAATADVHGAGLASSNIKHFPMVAGLAAPY